MESGARPGARQLWRGTTRGAPRRKRAEGSEADMVNRFTIQEGVRERAEGALLEFSKPKYKESAVFVEFLGWFEDPESVYLAMEYVPLGDLEENVIANGGTFKEEEVRTITAQILEGLKIMHLENFVHRDLKPKNVLVCQGSPHWWVKLADFGLSKRRTEETEFRTQTGTQAYMTPEILNYIPGINPETSEYTNAVDIWALGCIVYRLASGVVPFPLGLSLVTFCGDDSKFPSQGLELSELGNKFVRDIVVPYPSRRLTADQALDHPWTKLSSETSISNTGHQILQSNESGTDFFAGYNTATHAGLQSYGPASSIGVMVPDLVESRPPKTSYHQPTGEDDEEEPDGTAKLNSARTPDPRQEPSSAASTPFSRPGSQPVANEVEDPELTVNEIPGNSSSFNSRSPGAPTKIAKELTTEPATFAPEEYHPMSKPTLYDPMPMPQGGEKLQPEPGSSDSEYVSPRHKKLLAAPIALDLDYDGYEGRAPPMAIIKTTSVVLVANSRSKSTNDHPDYDADANPLTLDNLKKHNQNDHYRGNPPSSSRDGEQRNNDNDPYFPQTDERLEPNLCLRTPEEAYQHWLKRLPHSKHLLPSECGATQASEVSVMLKYLHLADDERGYISSLPAGNSGLSDHEDDSRLLSSSERWQSPNFCIRTAEQACEYRESAFNYSSPSEAGATLSFSGSASPSRRLSPSPTTNSSRNNVPTQTRVERPIFFGMVEPHNLQSREYVEPQSRTRFPKRQRSSSNNVNYGLAYTPRNLTSAAHPEVSHTHQGYYGVPRNPFVPPTIPRSSRQPQGSYEEPSNSFDPSAHLNVPELRQYRW